MHSINILSHLKRGLRRFLKRENGSSIVELAIIFPILLLLFAGVAELGRLFYTYTTLAKATKVGARYLSTSRDVTSPDATTRANAKLEAKSLVVCGYTDCTDRTPIVDGLETDNVIVCDNFSVPCSPAIPAGPIKYFKVEITDYPFSPGVFNVATRTGAESSIFYFSLTPGTEMRYMK